MLIRSTLLSSVLCVLAASAGAQSLKVHNSYVGAGIGITDPKSVHPNDRTDLRATPSILLGTSLTPDYNIGLEVEYRKVGVFANDYWHAQHLSFSVLAHNLASFNIGSNPSHLFFQPSISYTQSTTDFPLLPKSTVKGWQPSYSLGLQTKLLETSSTPYLLRTSYTLMPNRNDLPTNQILSLHVLRSFN